MSAVYEPTHLDPAEQLEKMVGNSLSSSDIATPSIPPVTASQPLAYQSSGSLSRRAPDYTGLKIGGSIILIFAGCYYALALVLLMLAAISAAGVAISQNSGLGVFSAFTFVTWGLTCIMVAGILHAVSTGCDALRDLARNSFRQ